MVEFKRESRFLVLKQDDIDRYLDSYLKSHLESITAMIREGREEEGRKDNSYVVINEDELYAKVVWKLIEISQTNPKGLPILLENLEVELRDLVERQKLDRLCRNAEKAPRGSFLNP